MLLESDCILIMETEKCKDDVEPIVYIAPKGDYSAHSFVIPFTDEIMKLSHESGVEIKIRACDTLGLGVTYKGTALPRWNTVFFAACGEMLPCDENKVTIHPTKKDEWGVPLLHIDMAWSDNELSMIRHQEKSINRIIAAMGGKKARLMSFLASARELAPGIQRKTIPGMGIHEVGGARMGTNPKKSVTNSYGQLWDVPNVFLCDGAVLPSMGYQNTTLTIQALAARAANQAAMLHQCGDL